MPDVDHPVKRLIQRNPKDWIIFVLPECKDSPFQEINTTFVKNIKPKKESRMDKFFVIGDNDKRFYLNLEPMGYYDNAISARMLRYRADFWEKTLANSQGLVALRQFVIYFFPEHENKNSHLQDYGGNNNFLDYQYGVIRLWEMKKSFVLENNLTSLYPLIPLMEKEEGETPEQIIQLAVKKIGEEKDGSLRSDLYAALSILGESNFSDDLIKKHIRRELLMESKLFKEWFGEEIKEATEKVEKEVAKKVEKEVAKKYEKEAAKKYEKEAAEKVEKEAAKKTIENSRQILISQLKAKYDLIPKQLKKDINLLDDQEDLNYLLEKFVKTASLAEFEQYLEKIKLS